MTINLIKLSRSTVERFISCPRCCVLEKTYQIKPPALPFSLNIAVDNLCKNEFDYYRNLNKPHPLFIKNGIEAIPYAHKDLNIWRNNYKGVRYKSLKYKYDFGGVIDDIWQKDNGDLILVDYKATARNNFDWDETFKKYEYPKAYKRQLEMYQWLFQKNGFKVASEAYIIYFNGKKNEPFFNNMIKFDAYFIKLDCCTDWVEEKIIETVELLRSRKFPRPSSECEHCKYLQQRWNLANKINL